MDLDLAAQEIYNKLINIEDYLNENGIDIFNTYLSNLHISFRSFNMSSDSGYRNNRQLEGFIQHAQEQYERIKQFINEGGIELYHELLDNYDAIEIAAETNSKYATLLAKIEHLRRVMHMEWVGVEQTRRDYDRLKNIWWDIWDFDNMRKRR